MEQQLITILQSIRPEFTFDRTQHFIADGLLDSFDLTLLVSDLDQQFGISIAGDDIIPEHFETLEAMQGLLQKYGVTR